jgi:ketosteroid isomerase-like protein
MERRTFLAAAAAAATVVPTMSAAAPAVTPGSDQDAIRKRLIDWYRAFANPRVDRVYYRSFVTDDYLLLENGELLDAAGDEALLDTAAEDQVRSDSFDFRKLRVDGDHGYAVYFLNSELNDPTNGERRLRFLESAVMRRVGGIWRVAVLHSTRIVPTAA